jgi:hypothetical protein
MNKVIDVQETIEALIKEWNQEFIDSIDREHIEFLRIWLRQCAMDAGIIVIESEEIA